MKPRPGPVPVRENTPYGWLWRSRLTGEWYMRTWGAGSYVEPARWHLAALGWLRYWLARLMGRVP